MLMSVVMTSGFRDSASETASRPSFAWPTTCNCESALKMVSSTLRMNAESSTTRTRYFFGTVVVMERLGDWHERSRYLRSRELFHGADQLIFLHGLGQEGRSAFFHCTVTMLCACARSDY